MKIRLVVLLIATSLGCGLVRPYVPSDAELLAREGRYKLWKAPHGFIVVATYQVADPRNEVCLFESLEAAEEHYAMRLAGERVWIPGCPCGAKGRVHDGYTYSDPEEANERCQKALAEAQAEG